MLYLEDFARLTRNAEDTAVDLRVSDMLRAELMSHKHLQKRVVLVAEVLDHPGKTITYSFQSGHIFSYLFLEFFLDKNIN